MKLLRIDTIYESDTLTVVCDWRSDRPERVDLDNLIPLDPVVAEIHFFVNGSFIRKDGNHLSIQDKRAALIAWEKWVREHTYFRVVCNPWDDRDLDMRIRMFTRLNFDLQNDGSMVLNWKKVYASWKKGN